ncbi:transposase-like protein [Streptacidiphilus sp. EB103A]
MEKRQLRRGHRRLDPTTPLIKARPSAGAAGARAASELRALLVACGSDETMLPTSDEPIQLLLAAGPLSRRIADESSRRTALVLRVLLCEWVRGELDGMQLRAVDDARRDGAEWAELAPALAVETASGAHKRASRLRAEALGSPGEPSVRRTPEAVVAVLADRAAEEARTRATALETRRNQARILDSAHALVEARSALLVDEDVEYWLDEVLETLDNVSRRDGPTEVQLAALTGCMRATLRGVTRLARDRGQAAASNAASQRTLEQVRRLLDRERS